MCTWFVSDIFSPEYYRAEFVLNVTIRIKYEAQKILKGISAAFE